MCGIAGSLGQAIPDQDAIDWTLQILQHRGPDAQGAYRGRLGSDQVTLLNRRLAIIDLDSRADQPAYYDGCVLTYNGEIYNYVEIRDELTACGHTFETQSDTEVLLHAYREWGLECLRRLEGMWSFALADTRANRLILCRDPFGEKPLFIVDVEGTLFFASEIKALASLSQRPLSVDPDQVRSFLVNGYRSLYKHGRGFFKGVREVQPGSYILIEEGQRTQCQYWRLRFCPEPISLPDAISETRSRLENALRIRLRSDVPLAFCLSGGIDSATLASLCVKVLCRDVYAFSIVGSDSRYDETEQMEAIVRDLNCPHDLIHIDESGFLERMHRLVKARDAPVSTISYYVHSFLSERIADQGYKVALSGTGADELFTGYYDHYAFWLATMQGRADFRDLLEDWKESYGAFVRNPVLKDPLVFVKGPERRDHIYLDREAFDSLLVTRFHERFHEADYADDLLRNRMLNELYHEIVPAILREDDANSMMFSIENRSPYLDRSLAEFLFTVPNKHLIRNGYVKWLLRAVGEGIVPDAVRFNKQKRGFNASILSVLAIDDPDTLAYLLEDGPIFDYVDRKAFGEFLDADFTQNSYSKFLFAFISSKCFLETDLAQGKVPRAS
jgi:asparagine synthase (glutamine-hydrolysing)